MTDVFLPLSTDVASISFRFLDSTGVSRNPYTGAVRTASRGGDRVGASLTFAPAGGKTSAGKQKRRKLLSTIMGMRGKQGRLVLTDPSYTPAGSFPATELLTNNDFSNGTTGWTGSSSTLSVQDGVLRVAATTGGTSTEAYQAGVSLTQYAPHALRTFILSGNWPAANTIGAAHGDGVTQYTDYSTTRGLRTAVGVALGTSGTQFPGVGQGVGVSVGSFYEIGWCSLSRCALVDNGPNALLQSQTFQTTWTVTNATITSNSVAAPDGTTTADTLNEDGTAGVQHLTYQGITVSSAAADHSYSISVKAGTRTWALLYLYENTGTHSVYAYVNLSTGAIGTTGSGGANFINQRAHSVNQGNGWFRVTITGRKTNAATGLTAFLYAAESDGDTTFDGLSAASLYLWGASLAQSSVPVRYTATTTTATTGTAQTGSGIYLKGLPASTSGLLLAGDWVEIITSLGSQLTMVTAPLDGDAAGLGYLSIAPAIRGTVADNAAVIIHNPTGRFICAGDISYLSEPGVFSSASIDLEESPF